MNPTEWSLPPLRQPLPLQILQPPRLPQLQQPPPRCRYEVVLLISKDVAPFFQRRKLIANQVIEKQLADGGLLIATTVGHANQVLPIVRYWLPHIRIVSPEALQHELEQSLRNYLQPSQRG